MQKFQVSVLLRGLELFSVMEVQVKESKSEDEWKKKDAKAQAHVVVKLSQSAVVHGLTFSTAKDMWNKIYSIYKLLQHQFPYTTAAFFQFKFEGVDIATFLAKLQEFKTQLKQAGEDISEKLLMTKVLMSLPLHMYNFVTA